MKRIDDFKYTYLKINKTSLLSILEILLVLSGISIFAWFIHGERLSFWIAIGGLMMTSIIISFAILRSANLLSLLGLDSLKRRIIIISIRGIVIAIIMAALIRKITGLSLFPFPLTFVAVISPVIGATEELIFRGFIQGNLKTSGIFLSIFLAAAGHSLYKYLVLRSLPVDVGIDFGWLVLSTFMLGLILGASREISGSVIPAMTWHVVFDIIFYGDFTEMPVWVWS